MKATISRDSLWLTIQSLSLSNQKWLAGKLQQNIREQEEASEEYVDDYAELLAQIHKNPAAGADLTCCIPDFRRYIVAGDIYF